MGSLPSFIEEVPSYRVDDAGRMHVEIGEISYVIPVNIWLDCCEAGKAAIVEWQRRQCGIDRKVVFLPER